MYGTAVTNKAIVAGRVAAPAVAADLIALLNGYSRRET
jgi:lipid-binding SYLF domain-containing protein